MGVSDSCPAVPLCFNREVCFPRQERHLSDDRSVFPRYRPRFARCMLEEMKPTGTRGARLTALRGSFDLVSKKGERMHRSDLRTFLRDIDNHELVVTALEAYLVTWEQMLRRAAMTKSGQTRNVCRADVLRQIEYVIQDLAERKKRLRDTDFGLPADASRARLSDVELDEHVPHREA